MAFSKKVSTIGYEFTTRYDTPYDTDFTLQYSNDNNVWINIHSFHQEYIGNKLYKFIFDKVYSAKYFRLYGVSRSGGGTDTYVTCGEFNLYTPKSICLVYKNKRYYSPDDIYFIDNEYVPLPINDISSNDMSLYGVNINEIGDKINEFDVFNIITKL